jgi:hypothetical protein
VNAGGEQRPPFPLFFKDFLINSENHFKEIIEISDIHLNQQYIIIKVDKRRTLRRNSGGIWAP